MALGEANKAKLYSWNGSTWDDVSELVLGGMAKNELRKPSTLSVKAAVEDGTARGYFAANKKLCLYVGTQLFAKYHCEEPTFNDDYTCEVTAYSSMGDTSKKRSLMRDTTTDTRYVDEETKDILDDELVVREIVAIDGTNNGGTTKMTLEVKNDNCLDFVNNVCDKRNLTWWMAYPGIAENNVGTDTLNLKDEREGDTSRYTFTTGDTGRGCTSSNNSDRLVNNVIVRGSGVGLGNVYSNMYLSMNDNARTKLSTTYDSWTTGTLAGNTGEGYSLALHDATNFANEGAIQIGDEVIEYTLKSGNNLVLVTRADKDYNYPAGTDVVNLGEYDAGDDLYKIDMSVEVGANLSVGGAYLGNELFKIGSISGNTLQDCVRGQGETWFGAALNPYAHTAGTYMYSSGYSPDSTGGSMGSYGRRGISLQDNMAKNRNELDFMGQAVLENRGDVVNEKTVDMTDVFDVLDGAYKVVTGTYVTISDTATGLSDKFKITAISLDLHGDFAMGSLEVDNSPQSDSEALYKTSVNSGGRPNAGFGDTSEDVFEFLGVSSTDGGVVSVVPPKGDEYWTRTESSGTYFLYPTTSGDVIQAWDGTDTYRALVYGSASLTGGVFSSANNVNLVSGYDAVIDNILVKDSATPSFKIRGLDGSTFKDIFKVSYVGEINAPKKMRLSELVYTDTTNNQDTFTMIGATIHKNTGGYQTVYENSSGCMLINFTICGADMLKVKVTVDGTATIYNWAASTNVTDKVPSGWRTEIPMFETNGGEYSLLFTLPPITAHSSLKIEVELNGDDLLVAAHGWVMELDVDP